MHNTASTNPTTDEVLSGVDLRGKRVLVTGVSAGIGAETARSLVAHGAIVIGTARDVTKAESAAKQIGESASNGGGLELVSLDLASLASVRRCADALVDAHHLFDSVILNAGVMSTPHGVTQDGFETQFGTNYVGHFVLANRLRSLLKPHSRLIAVSSAGHRGADVSLEDPNFKTTVYDPLLAYRRSKTALILFSVAFDRRHKNQSVRAAAVHPGAIQTETVKSLMKAMSSDQVAATASGFDWQTLPQGAATSVWAAFVVAADKIGGKYCENCSVAEIDDNPEHRTGVRSYALDPDRAEALWRKTEEMVGETF